MYTWGTTNLKITPGTYSPCHASNGLIEIEILPDASGNPTTVIQQAGRGRMKVNFEGFTTSYSDYKTLRDDYIALTQRTFNDGNDSLMMIISELSPAAMVVNGKWEYSMTLMEV